MESIDRQNYEKWVYQYRAKNKTDEAHIDDIAYAAFLAGKDYAIIGETNGKNAENTKL